MANSNDFPAVRQINRRIDEAVVEAHGAVMFLLMQGEDMGTQHEAYLRTCEHLLERIRLDRAAPVVDVLA